MPEISSSPRKPRCTPHSPREPDRHQSWYKVTRDIELDKSNADQWVAWSRARLSWGAGLAPLRDRARLSLVVVGGLLVVGDGGVTVTKSGLEIQKTTYW